MTSPSSTSSSDRPLLLTEGRTISRALGKLALWLLLAVPPVFVVNWYYARVRETPYDVRVKALERLAPEIEVLVVGSSQMVEGIDPRELGPHGFTMAWGSQDLYYDSAVLARFAPRLPKLRAVVWGLSSFSFGYDLARTRGEDRLVALFYDRWYPRREGTGGGQPPRYPLLTARGTDPIKTLWLSFFFTHAADKLDQVIANRGFEIPAEPLPREDVSDGRRRWNFHEALAHLVPVEQNLAIVIERTKALEAQGVRVLFVVAPTASTYRGDGERTAMFDSALAKLRATTGAEIHDFRGQFPDGEGLFRNSDHLQGEGTRRLSAEVRALLAR